MKTRTSGLLAILAVIGAILLFAPGGSQAAPNLVNYQGQLADSGGVPVPDGSYLMTFRVFNVDAGGTPLWEESQTVSVVDGVYNVLLGSAIPTMGSFSPALFSADNRWLEVEVNAEVLTPRQRVASVAYSLQTEEAGHAATADIAGLAKDADTVDGFEGATLEESAEIDGDIATHAANSSAHHSKTTTFPELSGQIADAQIPSIIARDLELSWGNLSGIPAGFADGVDNIGLLSETDPQVGGNLLNYVPIWNGSALVTGSIYDNGNIGIGTSFTSGTRFFIDDNASNTYVLRSRMSGTKAGSHANLLVSHETTYTGTTGYGKYGLDIEMSSNLWNGYVYGLLINNTSTNNTSVDGRNKYGVYINSSGSFAGGTGAATNNYALYLYSSGADNNYGIYEVSSADNYFAGNIGIGTSTPATKLSLAGTGSSNGLSIGEGQATPASLYHLSNALRIVAPGDRLQFGSVEYIEDCGGNCISLGGNVGIGTASPLEPLHVAGDYIRVDGLGGEQAYIGGDGWGGDVQIGSMNPAVENVSLWNVGSGSRMDLYVRALNIMGGADLAEPFEIAEAENIEPGMVVAINTERPGHLRISDRAYDRTVAGIVSGANGIRPGMTMKQEGTVAYGSIPVALTGRVYAWADSAYGSIMPGDLLTTSDTRGHAMKVTDYAKAPGAVIGKAMTSLKEGKGLVLVLVSLQ